MSSIFPESVACSGRVVAARFDRELPGGKLIDASSPTTSWWSFAPPLAEAGSDLLLLRFVKPFRHLRFIQPPPFEFLKQTKPCISGLKEVFQNQGIGLANLTPKAVVQGHTQHDSGFQAARRGNQSPTHLIDSHNWLHMPQPVAWASLDKERCEDWLEAWHEYPLHLTT